MDENVTAWMAALPKARKADAEALVALFGAATGFAPRMWGSMVGFGRYAYRYESGRTGESFPAGFAVRGAELTLYILSDGVDAGDLKAIGPHRAGKGCLYLKSMAGVDHEALTAIIRARMADVAARWPVAPA